VHPSISSWPFLLSIKYLHSHCRHLNKIKAYGIHRIVDIHLANRLFDFGKSPIVDFFNDGIRDAEDKYFVLLLDVVFKKPYWGGRGNDKEAPADFIS